MAGNKSAITENNISSSNDTEQEQEHKDWLEETRKQSALKKMAENEALAGNLVPRIDSINTTKQILSTAWQKIKSLPDIAPELVNKDADAIQLELNARVIALGSEITNALLELIEGE